jgi:hypothetical protein
MTRWRAAAVRRATVSLPLEDCRRAQILPTRAPSTTTRKIPASDEPVFVRQVRPKGVPSTATRTNQKAQQSSYSASLITDVRLEWALAEVSYNGIGDHANAGVYRYRQRSSGSRSDRTTSQRRSVLVNKRPISIPLTTIGREGRKD